MVRALILELFASFEFGPNCLAKALVIVITHEPLSRFERNALVERHCELFGTWPE
jgi:hypothetical protein